MNESTNPRARGEVVGSIRDFLLAAESLPSPRGAALQLLELSREPETSIDAVVRVVRSDPALSGFVVRAASAARFGRSERALDLKQAVIRLGMNIVRAHALALSLASYQPNTRCRRFDYFAFWTSALLKAAVMEALARHRGDLPEAEAFTLGLLSDIGKLVFATARPDDYDRVLASGATPHAELDSEERETFGFDHRELSAVLLADWGIPTALADVVYWQCDPEGGDFAPESRAYRLACGLQFASRLAQTCLAAQPAPESVAAVYLRGAVLDLSPDESLALATEALGELPQWTALVGLPKAGITTLPADWAG